MPLVDIIMPTRNRFSLTMDAVRSIQGQSFTDWQLWIMDDGSDDGSTERLTQECAKDDRINVTSGRKIGPMRQRQYAFELGDAPWVALIDSDDLWVPSKLDKQLAAARAKTDLVLCWYEWFAPNGSIRKVGEFDCLPPSPLVTNNMSIPLIRRSWLTQVGGFVPPGGLADLLTCDNIELYLRLLPGARVSVVKEVLTRCRDHSGPRASDASAALLGAQELDRVIEFHRMTLKPWPQESATLLAKAGARYIAAGNRRKGYGLFRASLRHLAFRRKVALFRIYAPFLVKDLMASAHTDRSFGRVV